MTPRHLGHSIDSGIVVDCRVACFIASCFNFISRTILSAATIGYKNGTGFPSPGAGTLGTPRPCRRCSTRSRRHKTICPPFVVTIRKAGTGYEDQMDQRSCSARVHDLER